ncbi:MAG: TolC family protein [Phycisphaerales bacterium]|nr:TolC family protein [Phycisphaerales bacterium]
MPPIGMSIKEPTQLRRLGVVGCCCALSACQSFTPRPLDMPAFNDDLQSRTNAFEPIEAFIERLDPSQRPANLSFDPSDGISPAEGEVIALFYNGDLRLARLEAGVALADKETAGLWEDPVFGFDGADIVSPSNRPFEWGIGVSLTIPISGRLEVERDRADAAWHAAVRSLIDAEWTTRAALRRHWTKWVLAQERITLLESTLKNLKTLDQRVQQVHDLEGINRVERRLFTIEMATREADLADARIKALEARTQLLSTLGLPPSGAGLLQPTLPTIDVLPPHDATARIINANTHLAVEFARYEVAEQSLRLEIQKQYPDIVLGPGYGTEFNDRRVMFGISIPIPILNANRAGIAHARAQREVARAAAETTFANLDRRLAAALHELDLSAQQTAHVEHTVVGLLKEQQHDLDRIAELGEVDLFVTLETIDKEVDARMRLLQLRQDRLHTATEVDWLLGPDVPLPPAPVIVSPDAHSNEEGAS